jgi:hypothetical protein
MVGQIRKKEKKENIGCLELYFIYGRFSSVNTTIAPTIAIAMIMTAAAAAMYISIGGNETCGDGIDVGAAASTANSWKCGL